jgi:hypothetical protein
VNITEFRQAKHRHQRGLSGGMEVQQNHSDHSVKADAAVVSRLGVDRSG